MSTEFQWVFDNAETISIDNKPNVSSSMTRSRVVRTVTRGGGSWQFTVKLPDGLPWDQYRQQISQMRRVDRHTATDVQINDAGYDSWFMPYQGEMSTTGWVVTATAGSNLLTITSRPSGTAGDIMFEPGDLIQLGSGGHVYEVVKQAVLGTDTTIQVHRPVIETTGSYILTVGSNVTFTVVCTQLPNYNLFQRNQVAWDSEFIFNEVI